MTRVSFMIRLVTSFLIINVTRAENVVTADNKFVVTLIDHLNGLPGQTYKYEGGIVINAQKTVSFILCDLSLNVFAPSVI